MKNLALLAALVSVLFVVVSCGSGDEAAPNDDTVSATDRTGGAGAGGTGASLSSIRLDPDLFGKGWKAADGLVLDSWDDIEGLREPLQATAAALRDSYEPLGIVALGSYACARTKPPLDSIDVRVFVFESSERCAEWIAKKYGYEGWEEHYTRTESDGIVRLDSTQTQKRIIASGRYWITSGHIGSGDEHRTALGSVASRLGIDLD